MSRLEAPSAAMSIFRPISRAFLVCSLLLILFGLTRAAAFQNDEWEPPRSTLALGSDGTRTLSFNHDILYDPRNSELFALPVSAAVGDDGRQYYVDSRDMVVRVLSPEGELLFVFGRGGEGPGEFMNPWNVDIGPTGDVYVYDRGRAEMNVFTADGEFIARTRVPQILYTNTIDGFIAADNGTIIIAGKSLVDSLFGLAIHVFRFDRSAVELEYINSFAPTTEYDPTIYLRVGGGRVFEDIDGGILYADANSYDLRKYTMGGQLLWQIEDPDALKSPIEYFRVSPQGRISLRMWARTSSFLPVGEDYFLHEMIIPPLEWAEHELRMEAPARDAPPFTRIFELIPRSDLARPELTFTTDEMISYLDADKEGRLYGLWNDWDPALIRSTVSMEGSLRIASPAPRR